MDICYALIENGVVVETHCAPPDPGFELPENAVSIDPGDFASVLVGATYDPQTDTFSNPAPPPRREVTYAEFLDRCPLSIQVALEVASETDPTIRVLTRNLQRPIVHLDHPLLIQGLNYLKSTYTGQGLIWETEQDADDFIAMLRADA